MLWQFGSIQKIKTRCYYRVFKTYIGNMNRVSILSTCRTFLSSWSSLTGNEIPASKILAEMYNEPIFFNTKFDSVNNPFVFLNKTPPAWAKGLCFVTIKDLCTVTLPGFITADEFIKSHTPCKHIYNPGYLDYLEILKRVLKDQQNKIK